VRIAVLTVLEADENMLCALKAGARGYVLKCVGAAELVSALRWVFDRRSGHLFPKASGRKASAAVGP
jgi:DNA-binding NarL/FixJ family response regulator